MTGAELLESKLAEMLPMLADIAKNEQALKIILLGLYDAGVKDGRASIEGMLQSVLTDLAAIVSAHVTKDALAVKAALDDFVARRCEIFGANPEARSVH